MGPRKRTWRGFWCAAAPRAHAQRVPWDFSPMGHRAGPIRQSLHESASRTTDPVTRRSSIAPRAAASRLAGGSRARRRRIAILVLALATAAIALGAPTMSAASVVGTARADSYSVMAGNVLTVPDPGVLDNDTVVAGSAAADLRNDVDHGSLDLDTDGGFRYEPDGGFVGTDAFSYRIPGGVLLLLPSNTVTVTITVTAPPTPAPTPAPTPKPTPKPTPTPEPTPAPTPRPTPLPTLGPVVTLPPVPSIGPLPSVLQVPVPTPTLRPTATPAPTRTPGATPAPTRSPDASPAPAGPIVTAPRSGSDPSSGGSGGSGSSGSAPPSARPVSAPFVVPSRTDIGDLDIDSALTLGDFEWAIPALVLTVPGMLLLLAVLAQGSMGILWLPVTRRWLGSDRRRRRLEPGAVSAA